MDFKKEVGIIYVWNGRTLIDTMKRRELTVPFTERWIVLERVRTARWRTLVLPTFLRQCLLLE